MSASPPFGRWIDLVRSSAFVRRHVVIVGVVLFVVGLAVASVLPSTVATWAVAVVMVVGHLGLLAAVAATVLGRRLLEARPDDDSPPASPAAVSKKGRISHGFRS